MIDFKKHCCICHKLGCKYEIDDDVYLCDKHFNMLLYTGQLFEGPDDNWHFKNEEDLKLL